MRSTGRRLFRKGLASVLGLGFLGRMEKQMERNMETENGNWACMGMFGVCGWEHKDLSNRITRSSLDPVSQGVVL